MILWLCNFYADFLNIFFYDKVCASTSKYTKYTELQIQIKMYVIIHTFKKTVNQASYVQIVI